MNDELYELTIKQAAELLVKGTISSVDLTKSCLSRIEKMEPEINAFVTICSEYALKAAASADKRLKTGKDLTLLTGIPYSLKDVYITKGIQTTACSNSLRGYIPQYNATVHKKLSDAGAVLIGKTNCDAFGFGASTEHSDFGVTKNPIDTTLVPGGSSGGSGAAVAYGGGLFSIGEDTGGSIRCPASFCGIVGLKPTYGLVSRYGSIAFASSFDTVGPMTKTVEDNAIVLSTIAGNDPHDATTTQDSVPDYYKRLSASLKGKVLGMPKECFGKGLDSAVRNIVEKAINKYEKLGCKVKQISLPNTDYGIAVYYVIGPSEASSNLARYDGFRYGAQSGGKDWKEMIRKTRGSSFNDEVKRRIMLGTYALSTGYADQYYNKAQKVRQQLKIDFDKAFEKVDVILTPTMPVLPFKIGSKTDDPLQMWLVDTYTAMINPIGLPGLSVPAGCTDKGLPVGMQLVGNHFSEADLYNFAHVFEADEV
ncbi:MAG: Asp-tRNA(Asn)/Glu-tRNA(Gln) amidotransferase subunit GatA [Patescibacteria group bacterium]|nr:Asp-tRNA(Asn)/Glu-tRNA(Gln) amidotransferase subunit GatA [Patescibacteria group bacterium]